MQYFSYINHTYICKNALHKAVFEFLKANDRKVINSENVEIFKREIIKGIGLQNSLHSRCKPIIASWTTAGTSDNDFMLDIGGIICYFFLYASKA